MRISVEEKCNGNLHSEEEEHEAEKKEPMSPTGSSYIHAKTDICILGVFGLSHQISLPCLKQVISNSVLKHPRFSSIPEESKDGTIIWVRKRNINIDDHIVIPQLDSDFIVADNFVENYVSSLTNSQKMDSSKPLWEVHVLNYKSSKDNSEATMIFRVHHSIGDCISLMSLLLDSTVRHDNPQHKLTIPTVKKSKKLGLPRCSIKSVFVWLWRMFLLIWNTIYFSFDVFLRLLYKDKKPMTTSQANTQNHKALAHLHMEVEDLKKIGKAIGGTINDVVMGIITAGLVCHLEELQDEGQLSGMKKLKDFKMSACIPVNIRTPAGLHDFKEMMKEENKSFRWGNDTSVWLVPVSMVKQSNWLDYCRDSTKMFQRRKQSYVAQTIFFFSSMIYKVFGSKALAQVFHWSSIRQTLLFSNIQGPLEEVRIGNAKVTSILTTISGQPQALIVYLQTYGTNAEITFLAGSESFVLPQRLSHECAHAFSKMKDEACQDL